MAGTTGTHRVYRIVAVAVFTGVTSLFFKDPKHKVVPLQYTERAIVEGPSSSSSSFFFLPTSVGARARRKRGERDF